ncbi:DUF1287 domain-containing protein [Bacillus sp. PK3_68]|uniref:DUF1287 domain-containing protein n=1 Tax=Bacillus sp. PK3_68 TaxID=2027408 RepID=UPI000E772B59|nr:DUF1287 domain-containing protein [Bacillus sp. PK3_68]RJS60200.1 DUF1287 domain-containing protein [Bacillus sp. PK3_68]
MNLNKFFIVFFMVLLLSALLFAFLFRNGLIFDMAGIDITHPFMKKVIIEEEYVRIDRNANGVADPIDIVNAARKEAEGRTLYKSAYYEGGYPPDREGVCTDVIWRGLKGVNINLKDLMDKDIHDQPYLYPRVNGKPDPNIDFRRVPNQHVFFQRFTQPLTTKLMPDNPKNLAEWQPGDIVVYLEGVDHIGIISDKRAKDGIPYLIHNTPPFASEIKLSSYTSPIAGHFRWKYETTSY